MTGSSGRQRVPVDCFASLLLTIPSDAVAQKFGQAVTPLMAQIRSNSEQNISIASIRDALLPKLLSDEIRVKESEQALEAAA
jgi:type I restriction enzyme S subunit